MTFRSMLLTATFVLAVGTAPALSAEEETKQQPAPPPAPSERCPQRQIPLGLYGAADQLLEAAYYAQWVLEDLVCKYPAEEEARKALAKLNLVIGKAEGR